MCLKFVEEDNCRYYPTDCYNCDYFWYESSDDEDHQLIVDLIDDAWLEIQAIFVILRRKLNEIF